jgi:hypothetical protein
MSKIYQLNGIPYYIKGCNSKAEAVLFAWKNRWGIDECNIEEVNEASIMYNADDFRMIEKK